MLHRLEVEGYRSLRNVRLTLRPVTVLVGPNGCGKSNLYRALQLLVHSARGAFARSIAAEGGMPSVLWAGARRKGPVRMRVAIEWDAWRYEWACGLPKATDAVFPTDPWIKTESLVLHDRGGPMLDRKGPSARARGADGRWTAHPLVLAPTESALAQIRDPARYPLLAEATAWMQAWRFYHQFRTDADSPIRQPQVGASTWQLHDDGRDLAAAWHTIAEVGDPAALDDFVDRAFPGAKVRVDSDDRGRVQVVMEQPGIRRPLEARELSDGTLRYLCLVAALLSPRPPALLALNEPETSLHPDVLPALAALIALAGRDTQVWLTTHSRPLADAVGREARVDPTELALQDGETRVIGQGLLD